MFIYHTIRKLPLRPRGVVYIEMTLKDVTIFEMKEKNNCGEDIESSEVEEKEEILNNIS
jgi:hypothetical protein